MSEVAFTWIRRPIVTVSEVASRHNAKSADRGQRPTLGSSQRIFTIARIVDHFAVTTARQVEATREHFARVGTVVARITIALWPSCIVPIAMVCAVRSVVPMVVAFTFAMVLWRRTGAASERQPVVIVVPMALVSVPVAWGALIAVVAWIEIHR